MKTYFDTCAVIIKNIDVLGLGCYDKSIYLAKCRGQSTSKKRWKIFGSRMTSGTQLDQTETFSKK